MVGTFYVAKVQQILLKVKDQSENTDHPQTAKICPSKNEQYILPYS